MKKTIFLITLLMTSLGMSAQMGTKIAAKLQKGDEAVYRTVMKTTIAGQEQTLTSETRYVVTEATAEGLTVESELIKIESTADKSDFVGRMMAMSSEATLNQKIVFTTDADGKVTALKNADEVLPKMKETVGKVIDELIAANPEMASMMPKEALQEQIDAGMSAETLLKAMQSSDSPFFLYGRTIGLGNMDSYTNEEGLKIRQLFFITSKEEPKVKMTYSLDMTKEEMKQMIIDQVAKTAPEQAEMVKQNIDMMMDSGMIKMEINGTANYEMLPTTWVKTMTDEMKQDIMGQQISCTKTVEQISANR